ncbi:MAG TPA: hypothetical protein VMC86_00155 [Gemmatimonadales bacterium]|nr:hypothetical protein [Gemmatimonadales bacterium]
MTDTAAGPSAYTPRFPTLTALALLSLWVVVLSLPMWSGQFLAGPMSDQYSAGWAIRHWGAEQWKATGHIPLWDPDRLGGVVVVAGFGDLFYPTAWLRLVLPTTVAVDLAFVVHYLLAGLFLYLLLRMLAVSWVGSVVGGTAYQLTGVVISYASPGHDGKLFVSALFPLMLIALVLGIRRRRMEGHALLGLTVGLALLSPQYQTTQYALLAAGIFALYLAFGEPEDLTVKQGATGILGAAIGVALGFGVSLIQVLPFVHYIPFSPRASAGGWEFATSYSTPWIHVPEFFLSGFTGQSFNGDYWGPNGLKLHSEYLGLPVIALAALGAGTSRRRLMKWIIGLGALFLLVALGDGTPFYRIWWSLVPYVNKTRAPGIAFYQVGFAVAVLAALGAERLERRDAKPWWTTAGLVTGGIVALLAAVGTFGMMATTYAQAHPTDNYGQSLVAAAAAAQSGITIGAVGSAVGLLLLAGLATLYLRERVPQRVFGIALILVVGADLYRAGAGFWHWSRPAEEQIASDDLVKRLIATPRPYRVFDPMPVYARDALMAFDIPQVTGYHGNHLQTSLNLLGGEGGENLHSANLWKLLDIRYLIFPDTVALHGYHRVLGPIRTGLGRRAYLYEADSAGVYARVVPAAVKADTSQIVPTLMDPRLDYNRLVLFSPDEPVNPLPVTEMPPASKSVATVAKWAAGAMTITMAPPPDSDSYLVVSENWYKDWKATVDGAPAPVLRGDESLITVPVHAGARSVALSFEPADYAKGKLITQVSLFLIVLLAGVPLAMRRMAGRRG